MFITRKALDRRTMLRGLGAAIALPLLDAMVPAGVALAQTAASPIRRLGFVYNADRGRPQLHRHQLLDAGGRGRELRAVADSDAASALPRSPDGNQRSRAAS